MAKAKKVYSYIKYPLARGGWYSLILGIISFAATQFVVFKTVSSSGDIDMFTAALGLSAILFSLLSAVFAVGGLREHEKNYRMTIAGAAVSLIVLIEWAVILS